MDYSKKTLGELLSSENPAIRRNATGILKQLQKEKIKPLLAIKKNLRDGIIDKTWNAIIFCPICGNETSANSGDYWQLPDDYEFKCCNKTMLLVKKSMSYNRLTR